MSCLVTLKQKGLKLTPQRRLIVDIIHNAREHLSAEDIIAAVRLRMPGVNKSTIYRTLEILEQAGCVYKSDTNDRFIYHHAEEGHHHHLVCTNCHTIEDVDACSIPSLKKTILKNSNFTSIYSHTLEFFGLCNLCSNN